MGSFFTTLDQTSSTSTLKGEVLPLNRASVYNQSDQ